MKPRKEASVSIAMAVCAGSKSMDDLHGRANWKANKRMQLGKALRRMAEVASHPSLKNALMHHREQTQVQKQRLESILQKHSANPRAHTDQAMQALINETEKMITVVKGDDLRDAALIASAQKVKHYEIAAYGTAAALAG